MNKQSNPLLGWLSRLWNRQPQQHPAQSNWSWGGQVPQLDMSSMQLHSPQRGTLPFSHVETDYTKPSRSPAPMKSPPMVNHLPPSHPTAGMSKKPMPPAAMPQQPMGSAAPGSPGKDMPQHGLPVDRVGQLGQESRNAWGGNSSVSRHKAQQNLGGAKQDFLDSPQSKQYFYPNGKPMHPQVAYNLAREGKLTQQPGQQAPHVTPRTQKGDPRGEGIALSMFDQELGAADPKPAARPQQSLQQPLGTEGTAGFRNQVMNEFNSGTLPSGPYGKRLGLGNRPSMTRTLRR